MLFVIGSGPAGVACAHALLEAGAEVTMLDVGRRYDAATGEAIARVAATPMEQWSPGLLRAIKGPSASGRELPEKLAWGSDFVYARGDSDILEQTGTKCLQSFALGGLSQVWGGAMLPHLPDEIAEWPISVEELAPHYRAVGELAWQSGRQDDLARLFPLYGAPLPGAAASRQAQIIEARLERHREALAAEGIFFGRSRLALRTERSGGAHACRQSGLCMTGCPWSAVWSSAVVLDQLVANRRFRYLPGHLLETVEERGGGIVLHCRGDVDGRATSLEGRHAFLAAGVTSTIRIVMQSLGRADAPLRLRFHPYFLLPMATFGSVPDVARERLHALSQLFLEIFDPRISRRVVHLQLYTYNELVREQMLARLRAVPGLGRLAEPLLLGRLAFVQGYLHSDENPGIEVVARPRAGKPRWGLHLRGRLEPRARRAMWRVAMKLGANARRIGGMPLPPLMHFGAPGEGNHVGGVFPMREAPGPLETDRLGRLPSLPRLSIVDASVLPALPATTLTFTAMANAHRIGALTARAIGAGGAMA